MNKDTVKGTIDDAAGRAKRQIGEWTGDTQTQAEGAGQQIKGKAEKVVGNVKDAAHDLGKKMNQNTREEEREEKREEHLEHSGSTRN